MAKKQRLKLKPRFAKIEFSQFNPIRNPEKYDTGIGCRKMRFNDWNGKPKKLAHREWICSYVKLKCYKGNLFARLGFQKQDGIIRYGKKWFPVALNEKHGAELKRRKKKFVSFLEPEEYSVMPKLVSGGGDENEN